jgi:hypothetical protein
MIYCWPGPVLGSQEQEGCAPWYYRADTLQDGEALNKFTHGTWVSKVEMQWVLEGYTTQWWLGKRMLGGPPETNLEGVV